MGTLEYMAPEVLLKQPGSVAADVYAFAVTLNELASGVYPFSDCTRDNPKAHTILDMGYGRCDPLAPSTSGCLHAGCWPPCDASLCEASLAAEQGDGVCRYMLHGFCLPEFKCPPTNDMVQCHRTD